MKAYLAEAHGIRALMYFYLLRTFGEVPIRLKATSSDADIEQMAKSSRQQVADQIIADLTVAEATAVASYGRQDYNKGRLTKYTIYAMQADVYLWLERYEEALAACNKITDSHLFGLINGLDKGNWFNTLYFVGNSNEALFEFQFDNQVTNPFYAAFVPANRRFVANEERVSDIFGIDSSDPDKKDIRGEMSAYNPLSTYMIWKYNGASTEGNLVRSSNESYAHWFAYRYAEILLFKAEALIYANPTDPVAGAEALQLIQQVRTRAQAISATEQVLDPENTDGISAYILQERARELAFEGKRWFDLLRFAKRNNYANLQILLDMVIQTAPPAKQQTTLAKFRDIRSHYLPIHDAELGAGKLLVQNSYYE